MLSVALALLLVPEAAAERATAHFALLGGPAFGSGSLTAFTQQTAASPKAQSSRGYGTGANIGLRGGFWAPDRPWGAAVDLSYLDLPVDGGGLRAGLFTVMGMLRPPGSGERSVFPYMGIGPTAYLLEARTDYRPQVAAAVRKLDGADKMDWTFESCVGLQARLATRLLLLAEARFSYLTLDDDWTPMTWMGPPARYRTGISTETLATALRIGLAVEL